MYRSYLLACCPKISQGAYYTAIKINRTKVEETACDTCKSRPTTKTRRVCCPGEGGVHAMFSGLKFHLKAIFLGLKFSNMNFPFLGGTNFQQLPFSLISIM